MANCNDKRESVRRLSECIGPQRDIGNINTEATTDAKYSRAYESGFSRTIRALRRKGLSFEDAQELAQAAWSRGWERLAQLRDPDQIEAWIKTIAFNMLRDRQSRQLALPFEEVIERGAMPDTSVVAIDIYRAILLSSSTHREVLDKLVAGYSTIEISQHLGISPGAAYHRIARARAFVRSRTSPNDRAA